MFVDTTSFLSAADPMVQAFALWTEAYRPYISLTADHLCYKCGSPAEFEHIRALFERDNAGFIYQATISDRRIAIIKLPTDVATPLGPLGHLELSDQKPDGSQTSGFDHIEVYPTLGTMEQQVLQLSYRGYKMTRKARPHHTTYDGKLPTANGETFILRMEPVALVKKIRTEIT